MNLGKIIIIIGAPGSGKFSLCDFLEKKYNFLHLKITKLVYEYAKKDPVLEKKLENGEFIEEGQVNEIIENFLNYNKNRNIIISGYPRTKNQLEFFKKFKYRTELIFYLKLDDEELLKRVQNRHICSVCDNRFFSNKESCCGVLFKRQDDEENFYKKRLGLFVKDHSEMDFKDFNFLEIDSSDSTENIAKKLFIYITRMNITF